MTASLVSSVRGERRKNGFYDQAPNQALFPLFPLVAAGACFFFRCLVTVAKPFFFISFGESWLSESCIKLKVVSQGERWRLGIK